MSLKLYRLTQIVLFYLPVVQIYLIFSSVISFVYTSEVYAQSEVYLSVRADGSGLIGIGIEEFTSSSGQNNKPSVESFLKEDLDVAGIFQVKTLSDSLSNLEGDLFGQWKSAGAKCLLMGEEGSNGNSLEIKLFDLKTAKLLLHEEYRIDSKRPWYTAHIIVDDMIEVFTGLRGSMASQIAFIRRVRESNEIFLIDADGRRSHQLTFSKTLKMSPTWSLDGNKIVYSVLEEADWLIVMIDIHTGQSIDISRWSGLNTTPALSPVEPDLVAFTSSREGNAEIYTCRTNGKELRRLTNHPRIDSSPSWSPDGKKIAFQSDRTGRPLIYVMNRNGKNCNRLTSSINAYEDSPCWSPRGDRIAFVVMSEYGLFDIATASPSGDDVIILTYGRASNEDPQWSPDGLRIIFSSTLSGSKRLYIMSRDGSNVRPLTGDDNSFLPAWAPSESGNNIRISSRR